MVMGFFPTGVRPPHCLPFSDGFVMRAIYNYLNLRAPLTAALTIVADASKAGAILEALRAGPEPEACVIGNLIKRDDKPAVILDQDDHWRQRA